MASGSFFPSISNSMGNTNVFPQYGLQIIPTLNSFQILPALPNVRIAIVDFNISLQAVGSNGYVELRFGSNVVLSLLSITTYLALHQVNLGDTPILSPTTNINLNIYNQGAGNCGVLYSMSYYLLMA